MTRREAEADPLAGFADMPALQSAGDHPADHLFRRLRRRLWWRHARLHGMRAALAAALVSAGFGAGSAYVRARPQAEPSYALALNGARLVLDSDDFTSVGRLAVLGRTDEADAAITRFLGRSIHAPHLRGYILRDVRLMRTDMLKVAGLRYESRQGRTLTLSLSTDPDGRPDPRSVVAENGREAIYWSDGWNSYGVLETAS